MKKKKANETFQKKKTKIDNMCESIGRLRVKGVLLGKKEKGSSCDINTTDGQYT